MQVVARGKRENRHSRRYKIPLIPFDVIRAVLRAISHFNILHNYPSFLPFSLSLSFYLYMYIIRVFLWFRKRAKESPLEKKTAIKFICRISDERIAVSSLLKRRTTIRLTISFLRLYKSYIQRCDGKWRTTLERKKKWE